MKYLVLSIALILCGFLSCNNEPISLNYCKMIEEDQSFVNTDKTDMNQFNLDKIERHKLFKKNFELLMMKTKQDGFPKVSLNNFKQDSCKYFAITMTMIHTAQSNPNVFFSEKYANLFKREMDKGNIEKKLLTQSATITAKTIDLCKDIKPDIKFAVELWGIDFSIFNEANFIDCN
jgi:hypothetical protein